MSLPESGRTRLIEIPEELEEICDRIRRHGRVAIDTEFFWERTFYPQLGLVQLALHEKQAWLIDIPALNNRLAPLGRILADPTIEKIIHDARQDLTILKNQTGSYPRNIFDTRLACGFIGPSANYSLFELCRTFADRNLSKEETRSNWLQRPLNPEQCQYALEDVIFLPRIRTAIKQKAELLERWAWIDEEMKLYDRPELYDDPPFDQVFTKVKGCRRLSGKELALLRELAAWREKEARRRDLPRRHVLSDEMLVNLAIRQPQTLASLKNNCDLPARSGQRHGQALLEAIKKGLQTPAELWPQPANERQKKTARAPYRKISDFILELGREHNLDPGLLANRQQIEDLIETRGSDPKRHPLLQGWRHEFAGRRIIADFLS
ncbi:MAG TPA: ribonuclease D [Proteobacteria bacterium]|nr:ribonuclease D [Pseudomonadota bacterium]